MKFLLEMIQKSPPPSGLLTLDYLIAYVDQIPLVGYPGPMFTAIHALALLCLAASVLVSFGLIVFRCCSNKMRCGRSSPRRVTVANSDVTVATLAGTTSQPKSSAKQENISNSFARWSLSERLVIYLAIADLCLGISHTLDHAYILYARSNPPDRVCVVMAFILQQFTFTQWIVVIYTAVRSSCLVVFQPEAGSGEVRLEVDPGGCRTALDHRNCHLLPGTPRTEWRLVSISRDNR